MTKDADFLNLLNRLGPPPQILWVTCGNTSNVWLRQILSATMPEALKLLTAGERMIETGDL